MKTIQEFVAEFAPHAVEIRHEIHANPEHGLEEYKTTELIKKELADYGIEIQELPDLKTGCTAVIYGGQPGKTLGLREDIDALVMKEITGLPFASTNGCAHACGHDMHTSILLLTARVLQQIRGQLKGNVRLFFQPSEEENGGARFALKAGMADVEPKAEAAIGLHCDPGYEVGTIAVRAGATDASEDDMVIEISGRAGHAAHPEQFIDPIACAAYLITQLQTTISRENNPLYPAVLTFGAINGGTVMNAVPDSVKILGTLRCTNEESRELLVNAIRRITKDCCDAMRCTAKVHLNTDEGVRALINDPDLAGKITAAAGKILGKDKVKNVPLPSMGSEDFSEFGRYFPVAQFRLGTANKQDARTRIGLHNPSNIFDENAIAVGASVMAQFVVDYLK